MGRALLIAGGRDQAETGPGTRAGGPERRRRRQGAAWIALTLGVSLSIATSAAAQPCGAPRLIAPAADCSVGEPCEIRLALDAAHGAIDTVDAVLTSSGSMGCADECEALSGASSRLCIMGLTPCNIQAAAFLALTDATFAPGDVVALEVTCNEPGLHSLDLEQVSLGREGREAATCGVGGSILCSGSGGPVCGDDEMEGAEECDGDDMNGASCLSLGLAGGTLACDGSCKLDTSGCVSAVTTTTTTSTTSTTSSSTTSSTSTSTTTSTTSTVPAPVCGNSMIEDGEDCDGASLGAGTCPGLGYTGGTLACNAQCRFDTAGCTIERCGNGVVDVDEECDPLNLGGETCVTRGYDGGTLACAADCSEFDTVGCRRGFCGNGNVDHGEECDRSNLDGQTCTSLGFGGGLLSCDQDTCLFDRSSCRGVCGDGAISHGEECDGSNLDGQDCVSRGFAGGELACADDCYFDHSSCKGVCGDGFVTHGEECDGGNLDGQTCGSRGFSGGNLACRDDCRFDHSSCKGVCGDGFVTHGEECDGGNLDGQTCGSRGFSGGELACRDDCRFDHSSCKGVCGDELITHGEECDGANLDGQDCLSRGFSGGGLSCRNDCRFDHSSCKGVCGDDIVTHGEECDGADLDGETCESLGFTGGRLACSDRCEFDRFGCTCSAPPSLVAPVTACAIGKPCKLSILLQTSSAAIGSFSATLHSNAQLGCASDCAAGSGLPGGTCATGADPCSFAVDGRGEEIDAGTLDEVAMVWVTCTELGTHSIDLRGVDLDNFGACGIRGEISCQRCATNTDCDDELWCNGAEVCQDEECVAGTPRCPGPDGDGDCSESCNETEQTCSDPDPAGTACDDDLFCTELDQCDAGGNCLGGADPCQGPDGDSDCRESCDEGLDDCLADDADASLCSDGLFCNGGEQCLAGACVAAGGLPCAGVDGDDDCSESCDEDADACDAPDPDGSDCDDGVFCNGPDSCRSGSCTVHDPVLCPQVVCGDSCNEQTQSCFSPAGTPCDGGVGVCDAGTCDGQGSCQVDAAPRGTACDEDGNPCTDDICDGFGQCIHDPLVGMPCDDDDPGDDPDDDGDDDDDLCMADRCDARGRCVERPQSGFACDDGDACTTGDVCADGTCVGRPVVCSGSHACNPSTGQCQAVQRPRDLVCINAATDPTLMLAGDMTVSTQHSAFIDREGLTAFNSLLVYADNADSMRSGSGDEASYVVDFPASGTWYATGRFLYPGRPGSNDANSFFIIFDGRRQKFGNNKGYFQLWHWDGNGNIERGPLEGLSLGHVETGMKRVVIERREVRPAGKQPRLDVLCFRRGDPTPPTDAEALAALLDQEPPEPPAPSPPPSCGTNGDCGSASATVCVAAASDATAMFANAMTWGRTHAGGDDEDPINDSLFPELVFADSTDNALRGNSGDEVEYLVDLPEPGHWLLTGRMYFPGDKGSNDANSFFVRVDGGPELKFGNNKDFFQTWHWDGDGDVERGAPAALSLGELAAGEHTISFSRREVRPVGKQPRLDAFCLRKNEHAPPTDQQACAAVVGGCPGFGALRSVGTSVVD